MQPKSAQSFTHMCLSEANLCLTPMNGFEHRLKSNMRLRREVNTLIIIGHNPTTLQPILSMHKKQKYSYTEN